MTDMLKIAACDDSPIFLENVVQLIKRWSEQSMIPVDIYTFDNGDALIKKNNFESMDIIFLDILMPLLNGMDTARELRQRDTAVRIIFLTSSPEFALESYDVKAQGYLLKPVAYEKVKEVLDECVSALDMEPEHLVLKIFDGYQKVYFHDIDYIEAQNKKVVLYLKTGRTINAIQPLRSLEDELAGNADFFKCHRSYLVYLPNVEYFDNNTISTKSGRSIPIARGGAKAFKEAYFARMFQ